MTGDQHDHPVDTHPQAAGRGHGVLHRLQEILVEFHRLPVPARGEQGLLLQAPALLDRIGQLAVGRTQLHAPGHQVPAFGDTRLAAMRTGQRRHRGGELRVERRRLGAVLDEVLVHLEDDGPLVPLAVIGNLGGIAQPAQRGELGPGVDVFAEGFGDRVVHGLDRPPARDVHRAQPPVGPGPHRHLGPVGGHGGILDQLAAAVDPDQVVRMRLIGLEQGELGVVAEVDPFIAERPAQFEHALDAPDAQPLQVELWGDSQVQIQVVGVDVGDERAGVGAAVDLLQDGRLHLDEILGEQRLPDRMQDLAAGPDQLAGLGVDGQVDIAGPHAGLGIRQALPLVGQRAQALAGQSPVPHQHRTGAGPADPHRAGDLDEIAQVDRRGERSGARAWFERRIVQQHLDFAGPVPQLGEDHTPVVADPKDPAGHADGGPVGFGERGADGVAGWLPDGIGVNSLGAQRIELVHPDPDLLGQPGRGRAVGQVDGESGDVRRRPVAVQAPRVDECLRNGGVVTGVLAVAPAERQHQESFGDHRRDTDPRDQPGVLVTRVAWHPFGQVLHVRAVQRFELPPSGEEDQHRAPQSCDGTGTELCAFFEGRPEHSEVQ